MAGCASAPRPRNSDTRRRHARAQPLPGARRSAAGRRLGPTPQQGVGRRQSAAAHALPLLLRPATPATSATPGSGCSALGGLQPHPRDPRRERRLHRGASVGHGRSDGRARGARSSCSAPAAPRAACRSSISIACRANAADRDRAASGEMITAVVLPRAAAGAAGLSQGARPRLLRVRAGVGRGDRRGGAGQDHVGPNRVRRRGAQAVAIAGGGGCADRASRHDGYLSRCRGCSR